MDEQELKAKAREMAEMLYGTEEGKQSSSTSFPGLSSPYATSTPSTASGQFSAGTPQHMANDDVARFRSAPIGA